MADRSVATTDVLDTLRTTYNSTAADVGDISTLTNASGLIASATDIVEAINLLNTEVTAIKQVPLRLKQRLPLKVQQMTLTKQF